MSFPRHRKFRGRRACKPAPLRGFATGLLVLLCLAPPVQAGIVDVRVLIDVSGSMRETDPHNLRVPAARLLINLLPDGARAGFWTFGTEGAVLVPAGTVDDGWRDRAMVRAERIDSSARYTDVADGLYLVDRNWAETGEADARIVILLTDGQVDVDDDPRLDAQSRLEILRQRVPAMQERGVRLYAVGLSADADVRLLEEMAVVSGGFAVVAADADALLGAFLDIFAAAMPVNAVPVERQQFRVDASVRELTVLAMHPYRHEPVSLRLPDGSTWHGADHGSASRWLAQDTFTLVHVSDPPQGDWVLLGGGRDTRVHIHSNLGVSLQGVHQHALAGEVQQVSARLESADGTPLSQDFLDLLHYRLRLVPPAGEPVELAGSALPEGGVEVSVPVPEAPGLYRVEAVATAGIIHRQATSLLRVYEDAWRVGEEEIEGAGGKGRRFTLRVRADVVDTGGLRVSGMLRGPDGRTAPVSVAQAPDGWTAEVAGVPGVQEFRYRLEGRMRDGRRFQSLTPARLFGEPPAAFPEEAPAEPAPAEPAPEEPADPAWAMIVGVLLTLLAVGGPGLLLFLRWRSGKRAKPPGEEGRGGARERESGPPAGGHDLPPIVELTQSPGQAGPDQRGGR